MEFDIKRVYTSVNADELKIGSKVIVADNLNDLKERVKECDDIKILGAILSDNYENRFNCNYEDYNLCYLVEEPKEKKLKWTDLKIGNVIRKTSMIQDFIVDDKPRLAVFDTSTPYYQFVVKMKQVTSETDVDSWMRDSRSQFAFNQGYEAGRLLDKDRTVYMENRLQIEEEKRKKLVELLRENGVIVDATGDKIRIDTIVDKYGKETHFIARWI